MSTLLKFRNNETNEVFTSAEINEMPTGHYQCVDLYHTEMVVTCDRNVIVSGFGHGISSEVLADEFDGAFVGYEYYECDRSATDFLRKKGLLD